MISELAGALTYDFLAVWPLHWLIGLKGALPSNLISPQYFPRVFAWIVRFQSAVSSAKASSPQPKTLKGVDAIKQILSHTLSEYNDGLVDNDPSGLKVGEEVMLWPIDSGSKHKDRGCLVSLSFKEIVVESKTKAEEETIRIHTPRHGFRIHRTEGSPSSKL